MDGTGTLGDARFRTAGRPGRFGHRVAVVGSGPGGALTACLLAEAGLDVVLIEEGPYVEPGAVAPFGLDEMVAKYRDGGLTAAAGPVTLSYVEGCCVGGGSEINSGLYHRTPGEVLGRWRRDYKVDGLAEADMAPHFAANERDLHVGPLPGPAPAASLKLKEGAGRLGWGSVEVPRWFRYDGGGPDLGTGPHAIAPSYEYPKPHSTGVRQSMTRTYVPRALAAGCRLLPGSRVESLRRDGGRWSLRGRGPGGEPFALEAASAFVCGGAIQTPALLRRSGFRRRVGDTLRVHPTVKVVARFGEPLGDGPAAVAVHQVREFAPRFAFGGSVGTPAHLAVGLVDHPGLLREPGLDWRCLGAYYVMTAGAGVGSVRVVPGLCGPLVRYRVARADLEALAEGLRHLCRLLFAAGATALYPGVAGLGPFRSAEGLDPWPRRLPARGTRLMTIHLSSSCPMGEDPGRCAVDSFGRVRGADGLYVADAGLLPTPPGVNPQGTIMALARRNALAFLGRL